jgi:hypothetical protein
MFYKKMMHFILVMTLVLLPLIAQTAEPPPWAEHIMTELGCMGGMFGEVNGKIFVDGVIMDDGSKLKKNGFKIEPGAPYRVSVTKVNNSKYEVSVKRMDQPGKSEIKTLEIK